jgi:hypothetical protein
VTESKKAGASQIFLLAALLLAGLALAVTAIAFSLDIPDRFSNDWGQEPPKSNDGRPWRIGYYEGGPYRDYPQYLRALIDGLAKLGWIRPVDLASAGTATDDSVGLWAQLAAKGSGPYIEFVGSACWSGDWDPAAQDRNRRLALEALWISGDTIRIIAGMPASEFVSMAESRLWLLANMLEPSSMRPDRYSRWGAAPGQASFGCCDLFFRGRPALRGRRRRSRSFSRRWTKALAPRGRPVFSWRRIVWTVWSSSGLARYSRQEQTQPPILSVSHLVSQMPSGLPVT